jgi:hypothetical protein
MNYTEEAGKAFNAEIERLFSGYEERHAGDFRACFREALVALLKTSERLKECEQRRAQ